MLTATRGENKKHQNKRASYRNFFHSMTSYVLQYNYTPQDTVCQDTSYIYQPHPSKAKKRQTGQKPGGACLPVSFLVNL
jgi:hypothetical protein